MKYLILVHIISSLVFSSISVLVQFIFQHPALPSISGSVYSILHSDFPSLFHLKTLRLKIAYVFFLRSLFHHTPFSVTLYTSWVHLLQLADSTKLDIGVDKGMFWTELGFWGERDYSPLMPWTIYGCPHGGNVSGGSCPTLQPFILCPGAQG